MGDKAFTPAGPAPGANSRGGFPVTILIGCAIAFAGFFLVVVLLLAAALILPAVVAARNAARVTVSSNNLRQIGLAIHNYHDRYITLPPAGSNDKKIGLGLSWRVRILPHVEQGPLFDKFDFKSPWDSPQNKALIEQMPKLYQAPGVDLPAGKTVYLGVAGAAPGDAGEWHLRRTAFNHSARPTGLADFLDGTSNSIVVVEADASEAVIWTKPDDWEFDPQAPRHGLGSLRGAGFTALFADGSTDFISTKVSDETLRRLFVITDGQPLEGYLPPYHRKAPGPNRRIR